MLQKLFRQDISYGKPLATKSSDSSVIKSTTASGVVAGQAGVVGAIPAADKNQKNNQ